MPPEINPHDTFIIVHSDFNPSKKLPVVQKIKATFPEVLFPSVDFNIKGVAELSEIFNSYIYLKVVDKKRHHLILSTLKKGLVSNEFKPIGTISGAELQSFFTKYQEEQERAFSPGDFIQVKSGDFQGAKFPVLTVDKDKVYCQIQILSFQRTLSFDISRVQKTEVDQLPPNPFINYEALAKKMKQRTAVVIDGTFLMFRSVFRHSTLFAKRNTKFVGGSYGFYLTLIKLKTLYPEAEIFVVFDSKNTTKYQLNPEYKANRQKFTNVFWDRFNQNQDWVDRMILNLGFSRVKVEGQEGDDVVGSLAHALTSEHDYAHAFIYSTDTDFHSLVSSQITHLQPKRSSSGPGETLYADPEHVCKHFGVNDVSKVNWVRACQGDGSDNIQSVNQYNQNNNLDHRVVQSRFFTQCANSAQSFSHYKELLATKPSLAEFLESQFDKNLSLLTIDTSLFKEVKDLPTKYKGVWNEKAILDLLEENSFYREMDSFTRHGRVLRSEW